MSIPADRIALQTRPWYREPWAWGIMAAPFAAIVMGVVMVTLASRSNDGLVADDYYKRGLAINQTLDRYERARVIGVQATASFNADRTRVRLSVPEAKDDALTLRFVHPTRAGLDQTVRLERSAGGLYEGAMASPALGHWHLTLEDANGTWRITGVWSPAEDAARLEPSALR
jgi:hypothetical protein